MGRRFVYLACDATLLYLLATVCITFCCRTTTTTSFSLQVFHVYKLLTEVFPVKLFMNTCMCTHTHTHTKHNYKYCKTLNNIKKQKQAGEYLTILIPEQQRKGINATNEKKHWKHSDYDQVTEVSITSGIGSRSVLKKSLVWNFKWQTKTESYSLDVWMSVRSLSFLPL